MKHAGWFFFPPEAKHFPVDTCDETNKKYIYIIRKYYQHIFIRVRRGVSEFESSAVFKVWVPIVAEGCNFHDGCSKNAS